MNTSKFRKFLPKIWKICFLGIILSGGLKAIAQDFRGSISGVVTEHSGAVVQGAQVKVTNSETSLTQNITTDENGIYNALYLVSGKYRVEVLVPNFKKLYRENILIRMGEKLTIDWELEVGSINSAVVITTEVPQIETANAGIGQIIDSQRISELPLSDGNPFTLTRLAGGITNTGG